MFIKKRMVQMMILNLLVASLLTLSGCSMLTSEKAGSDIETNVDVADEGEEADETQITK